MLLDIIDTPEIIRRRPADVTDVIANCLMLHGEQKNVSILHVSSVQ